MSCARGWDLSLRIVSTNDADYLFWPARCYIMNTTRCAVLMIFVRCSRACKCVCVRWGLLPQLTPAFVFAVGAAVAAFVGVVDVLDEGAYFSG